MSAVVETEHSGSKSSNLRKSVAVGAIVAVCLCRARERQS